MKIFEVQILSYHAINAISICSQGKIVLRNVGDGCWNEWQSVSVTSLRCWSGVWLPKLDLGTRNKRTRLSDVSPCPRYSDMTVCELLSMSEFMSESVSDMCFEYGLGHELMSELVPVSVHLCSGPTLEIINYFCHWVSYGSHMIYWAHCSSQVDLSVRWFLFWFKWCANKINHPVNLAINTGYFMKSKLFKSAFEK